MSGSSIALQRNVMSGDRRVTNLTEPYDVNHHTAPLVLRYLPINKIINDSP
jgi:hypothetical protein